MARSRRAPAARVLWRDSSAGVEAYHKARALAQERANVLGMDHGMECNDLFKTWRYFALPQRQNRYGHELMCEVVMCEDLDRCQMGHGPQR